MTLMTIDAFQGQKIEIFINRIPTRDSLYHRGIISHDYRFCVNDCGVEESLTHIFFDCNVLHKVWVEISSSFECCSFVSSSILWVSKLLIETK
jgi:hypothetical protein